MTADYVRFSVIPEWLPCYVYLLKANKIVLCGTRYATGFKLSSWRSTALQSLASTLIKDS